MKVKLIAAILLIGFLVNSCFPLCGCSPVEPDTMIDIVIKNSAGEDMLRPATQGYFKADDIELYSLEDGNKVKNTKPYQASIAQGVQFDQNTFDDALYRLTIYSNYPPSNHKAVTLLEFKNVQTDTLTCSYLASGVDMAEIKVNGKTAWTAASEKYKTIEITVDR